MSKSKSEKSAKAKPHVFIVDDHQMLRQGIKAMINLEADMVVTRSTPRSRGRRWMIGRSSGKRIRRG